MGREGRLTIRGPPNQRQKPAKDDGSPRFSGSKCICRVRHIPPLARRDLEPERAWNRIGPLAPRINFPRFRHRTRGSHTAETPHRGQIQPSRTLCWWIRLRATETAEPGKTRLNAEYGISPAREECARSDGAPKWPRRNLNLPLAAGPRVRHIRAHGAVAEWLKAAVC